MKNVQITEELFSRIYGYFLLGKRDSLSEDIICRELQDKMDRLIAHEDYSRKIEGR